jgi:phage terminase small subunit
MNKTNNLTKKELPKLTRKQAAFVKYIIEHPKESATKAAVASYDLSNNNVAKSVASENLTKPAIISHLESHSELVENTLLNTVRDYANSDKLGYRALAVDTSKYIHDKIHGKAIQRSEVTTRGVTLSIDLTSSLQGTEQE